METDFVNSEEDHINPVPMHLLYVKVFYTGYLSYFDNMSIFKKAKAILMCYNQEILYSLSNCSITFILCYGGLVE